MSKDVTDLNHGHIYTETDLKLLRNILHFTTIIDVIINGLAIYIVKKYSTPVMKIYKWFIILTIVCAFLVDFHLSFIFGPMVMLPSPILCGVGVFFRYFDYYGTHTILYVNFENFLGFYITKICRVLHI